MVTDRQVTILLVEDDDDMAEVVAVFLSTVTQPPIDVVRTDALEPALERLGCGGIDLVLLDLTLPDSSGLETFAHLHRTCPHIPVVVMTAVSDEDQAVRAVGDGAEDYLFKGTLTRLQIVRTVRYALERSARRRAEAQLAVNQRELTIARQIQQQLYPRSVPTIGGYELAGWALPAEAVGGDYYDFVPLEDGTVLVAVGDASGHGVGPAMLMAETRACLRTLALVERSVQVMLAKTGELLSDGMLDDHFVTLLLMRLDPRTRVLTYVGAGHGPATVFDATGHVRTLLESCTVPLGIPGDNRAPIERSVTLHTGDLVVVTTDGVGEAGIDVDTPFGMQGICRIVQSHRHGSAAGIVRSLVQAVRSHCFPHAPTDDMTAVALRVRPDRPGKGRRLSVERQRGRRSTQIAEVEASVRMQTRGNGGAEIRSGCSDR